MSVKHSMWGNHPLLPLITLCSSFLFLTFTSCGTSVGTFGPPQLVLHSLMNTQPITETNLVQLKKMMQANVKVSKTWMIG
jgi:hypothetical protein